MGNLFFEQLFNYYKNEEKMISTRKLSFVTFLWILFWIGLTGGIAFYYMEQTIWLIINQLSPFVMDTSKPSSHELMIITQINLTLETLKAYLPYLLIALFLSTSLLLWLCIRFHVVRSIQKDRSESSEKESSKKTENKDKKIAESEGPSKQERKRNERFRSIHLMSLLQREGRLLDFFNEDLDNFNNEQIGAAVRKIHADCKSAIQKYIGPKPILDQNEGENVTIEPGFDPSSIKMTGNVSGKPPFKGTLQHRGWRCSKFEMPGLSNVKDPNIISPAEVEIQ
jgi:hypothetical protein